MGHTLKDPLKAALAHDGGHALTAVGVSYLIFLLLLLAIKVPPQTALVLSGLVGFLLPALVQEYLDYRKYGLTADGVHDVATYAPILGLNLILAGQFAAGLAIFVLVAVVEVVFYWNLIRSR